MEESNEEKQQANDLTFVEKMQLIPHSGKALALLQSDSSMQIVSSSLPFVEFKSLASIIGFQGDDLTCKITSVIESLLSNWKKDPLIAEKEAIACWNS